MNKKVGVYTVLITLTFFFFACEMDFINPFQETTYKAEKTSNPVFNPTPESTSESTPDSTSESTSGSTPDSTGEPTPEPTPDSTGEPNWEPTPGTDDNINDMMTGGVGPTDPSIAINDSGDAILAWINYDSTSTLRLYIGEYTGGSWTFPTDETEYIDTGTGNIDVPDVAIDNNGNKIVVWRQNNNIYKSEYRGGSWTHPADANDHINPSGFSQTYNPKVAMNDNNRAIIVYIGVVVSSQKIYKSEYFTGTWVHTEDTNAYFDPVECNFTGSPQVSMDNNNNVIIAYHSDYSSYKRIYVSEYRSGSWTHPSGGADFISLNETINAYYPELSMGNNGEAILLWEFTSSPSHLYLSEYRSGTWSGPSDVNDFIDPSDGNGIMSYHAAMNNNGDTLLVYNVFLNAVGYRIFISKYSSGSWDHPPDGNAYISPDGGDNATMPQCDLADNGNAIIAWKQRDTSANDYIQISENRNNTWNHPTGISDNIISPDGDADAPFVCNNNNFVSILWIESNKLFLYERR